jgi:hypothetical protein
VGRCGRALGGLDDVGGILALEPRLDAVIALWMLFIALYPATLAVEASAARFGVSLAGDGFPWQWRGGFEAAL